MRSWKFYATFISVFAAVFFAFDTALPLSYMPAPLSFGACLWFLAFAWFLRMDWKQATA